MNEELTPERVDQEFAAMIQDVDVAVPAPPVAPPPPVAPVMRRAWRWGKPIVFVALVAGTWWAIQDAIAHWYGIELINARPEMKSARMMQLLGDFMWPTLLAAATGIAAFVVFILMVQYWNKAFGAVFHRMPIDHPRAGSASWAMSNRAQRQMVAEHLYATHYDGDDGTLLNATLRRFDERIAEAEQQGKTRKHARLIRKRAQLAAATRYTLDLGDAHKYAPHRFPGTNVNYGRAAAYVAGGTAITAGLIFIGALFSVGTYYKGANWLLRDDKR